MTESTTGLTYGGAMQVYIDQFNCMHANLLELLEFIQHIDSPSHYIRIEGKYVELIDHVIHQMPLKLITPWCISTSERRTCDICRTFRLISFVICSTFELYYILGVAFFVCSTCVSECVCVCQCTRVNRVGCHYHYSHICCGQFETTPSSSVCFGIIMVDANRQTSVLVSHFSFGCVYLLLLSQLKNYSQHKQNHPKHILFLYFVIISQS